MHWYILDEQVAWQRWHEPEPDPGVLVFRFGFGVNFSDFVHLWHP